MTRLDALTWPARHPRSALLIAAGLALVSLLGIRRLHADPSLEQMFSRDDPAAQSAVRVLNDFSAAEELLLLVTAPDDASQDKLLAFAKRLDDAVKNSPDAAAMTDGIVYRIDPQMRKFFEEVVAPEGLFYLDD